jgi:hypothetical protein
MFEGLNLKSADNRISHKAAILAVGQVGKHSEQGAKLSSQRFGVWYYLIGPADTSFHWRPSAQRAASRLLLALVGSDAAAPSPPAMDRTLPACCAISFAAR